MSRLRDERGFTLVELLVSATMMLIILGATLTVFEAMQRQRTLSLRAMDAQQTTRQTLDRMARQLRNLASPSDVRSVAGTLPRSIDRDLPYDLVFKDVDQVQPAGSLNTPNVRRVRYCLDASTPSAGVLWMQTQTWTSATAPTLPADTSCPGSTASWNGGPAQRVATGVTNANATPARALFSYSGDVGAITGTDPNSRANIDRIQADVFVDADPLKPPKEAELSTGVFLRNQNREPLAQFTVTVVQPTTGTIQLNGSASQDPESQPLDYVWNVDGTDLATKGIVVQVSLAKGTTHTIYLKAFDPARLEGDSAKQTVTL